jgi:dCMP deaminase
VRPSRVVHYMDMAYLLSKRSTCVRLSVGCVIVDYFSKKVVSTGYNGPPSGSPHCGGDVCPGVLDGCKQSIHAEINALDTLPNECGPRLDIYLTHSPCAQCCKRIVDMATHREQFINRLFFCHEYRNTTHLDNFDRIVTMYRVTPSGFVTRWLDNTILDPLQFYD